MLVRITWALVLAALGCLIAGFITSNSNVLLILAIGFAVAAILLVLASWARRAKETTPAFDDDITFDASEESDEDEELYASLEGTDEFVAGTGRSTRSTRTKSAPARRKSAAPKAKPKAPAREPRATPKTAAAKRKPAARKAKPKAQGASTTRSKPKPTRRRPDSS